MAEDLLVDPATLREQVRDKYRDVALAPHAEHHFHTGRPLAARLGYDQTVVGGFPDLGMSLLLDTARNGTPEQLRRAVRDTCHGTRSTCSRPSADWCSPTRSARNWC